MADLQKIIAFFIGVVLLIPLVQGFGVTAAFWDTNPLQLHPGEEKTVALELQNVVGGEDITVLAKITEGADIATLVDDSNKYLVPLGRKDIMVNILIKLSPDAVPGEKRDVAVSFTTVTKESNGEMIQLVSGIGKKIPIVVVSDQLSGAQVAGVSDGPLSLATIAILALIIVAVVLLGLILRKRILSRE